MQLYDVESSESIDKAGKLPTKMPVGSVNRLRQTLNLAVCTDLNDWTMPFKRLAFWLWEVDISSMNLPTIDRIPSLLTSNISGSKHKLFK